MAQFDPSRFKWHNNPAGRNFTPASLLKPFSTFEPSRMEQTIANTANSAMRGAILLKQMRARRVGIPQMEAKENEVRKGREYNGVNRDWALLKTSKNQLDEQENKRRNLVKNKITLVDLLYADFAFASPENPHGVVTMGAAAQLSKRGYNYLEFQTIPRSVSVDSDNKWVAIATMGRNVPHYQYTGSEETIEFEVSWYSTKPYLDDVIEKCMYLESLAKSNGYDHSPRVLALLWGMNRALFRDHIFIMEKAPYRLSGFNNSYQGVNGDIINTSLIPVLATQTITLKRISKYNIGWRDMVYSGTDNGLFAPAN